MTLTSRERPLPLRKVDRQESLNSALVQEIARGSQYADESIVPKGDGFGVTLSTLTDPKSFLVFDLGFLAKKQTQQMLDTLTRDWVPEHTDLNRSNFPVTSFDEFAKLPATQQRLGLVVYAPSM